MKRVVLVSVCIVGLCGVSACGNDDPNKTGSGGAASGGTSGSSGSGGSAASAGTGGSGGSSGAEAGVVCAPPSDGTKAALCVSLTPESIEFQPNNAAFDGKGFLLVEVFDTPLPDSNTTAIASQVFPPQTADAGSIVEAPLSSLVANAVRFDNLPTGGKAYVRSVFVDNVAVIAAGAPVPGVWFGGVDVANGIAMDPPLLEVAAPAGQGTPVAQALVALRKLAVTVKRSANLTPLGNGQGTLYFVVTNSTTFDSNSKAFGIGSWPCGDLSGSGTFTIDGFVFGNSPRSVAVFLDDFGVGFEQLPSGSMSSLQNGAGAFQIPASGQLTIPADAYATAVSVDLVTAFPAPDGGAPVTCSGADAGSTDAGTGDATTD